MLRNRVRRRLRAILREMGLDLVPGRYLIGARQAVSALTYRGLRADLVQLLVAAEALNAASVTPDTSVDA